MSKRVYIFNNMINLKLLHFYIYNYKSIYEIKLINKKLR